MGKRGLAAIAIFVLAVLAGCGDEGKRYGDAKIADRLHLEEADHNYAIDGDPFCEVEHQLLNDPDEVQSAADDDKVGLVVASAETNVGVKGVAPFAQDCRATAKKRLNKLDPAPKGD